MEECQHMVCYVCATRLVRTMLRDKGSQLSKHGQLPCPATMQGGPGGCTSFMTVAKVGELVRKSQHNENVREDLKREMEGAGKVGVGPAFTLPPSLSRIDWSWFHRTK